jgi:hypothetical protein
MPDHAPAPTGRRIALIAHDNNWSRANGPGVFT